MACHFFHVVSFFKTGKFVVGPMSCEQRESRHTDWLYVVPPLCGFDAEQYKMSHAWIPFGAPSVHQFVHPMGERTTAPLSLFSLPPDSTLPLFNRFTSSSVVPSNGMIAVADVRRLS